VTGLTIGYTYIIDRFAFQLVFSGTWTSTQDTDVPSGQGFANSLKLSCTTANASLSSSSYAIFQHRIEGQNLQHLKKGTSNAESVTLSFWVKSNKTGTYQVNLQDQDNVRIIGNTYTINTADTWEKKTITFAGDTTGALDNDNANSFQVEWWLASGTDFNSGAVPTTWEAKVNTDRAAGGTVNLADSTSNYINITGVQLEIGDTATPFENRMYSQELAMCQRYYYELNGTAANTPFGMCIANSTTQIQSVIPFPVTMRSSPTLSYSSTASKFRARIGGSNHDGTALPNTLLAKPYASYVTQEVATGMTPGEGGVWRTADATETFIAFSAEL
jgi:hypothetical protein